MKFIEKILYILSNCFKNNKLEEDKELFNKIIEKQKILLIIVTK